MRGGGLATNAPPSSPPLPRTPHHDPHPRRILPFARGGPPQYISTPPAWRSPPARITALSPVANGGMVFSSPLVRRAGTCPGPSASTVCLASRFSCCAAVWAVTWRRRLPLVPSWRIGWHRRRWPSRLTGNCICLPMTGLECTGTTVRYVLVRASPCRCRSPG